MRTLACVCALVILAAGLSIPVYAEDVQTQLSAEVDPEAGLSDEILDLVGEYDGAVEGFGARLLEVLKGTLGRLDGLGLRDALGTLGLILAAALFCALLEDSPQGKAAAPLVGALAMTGACIRPMGSMLALGVETIRELHEYMRLLIPGMTGLMTVTGGFSAAAGSGLGMLLFDGLLALTEGLLTPLVGLFLTLGTAESALGLEQLARLRDFVKWLLVTSVKLLMWGYSAILTGTGLVSAAVDGQKLRTLRAAIAGMVPVVGNLVSEASASILGAASLLRAGAGLYGMLAVFGIALGPFLRMSVHFLLLKLAGALCGLFGKGSQSPLLEKLTQAMGLLLALTGIACLLALMILTLCIRTVTL